MQILPRVSTAGATIEKVEDFVEKVRNQMDPVFRQLTAEVEAL
jgi:hypothetical protein